MNGSKGKKLAFDASCDLHRLASRAQVAAALVLKETPDFGPVADAVCGHLELAARHSEFSKIIAVFDGSAPPGKLVVAGRRKAAREALQRVTAALAAAEEPDSSDVQKAAACFINGGMVRACVARINRSDNPKLAAVVAIHEADSQLLHMALTGAADFILTLDSDMIAAGTPHVLLMPPPAAGSLNFSSGESVWLFDKEQLASDATASA